MSTTERDWQKDADDERMNSLRRCVSCKHARDKSTSKGTLICTRHDMFINVSVDEIPDDCPEFVQMPNGASEHAAPESRHV